MTMSAHGCHSVALRLVPNDVWISGIMELTGQYLNDPICVPGTPVDLISAFPEVHALSAAYVGLIDDEVRGHDGTEAGSMMAAAGFGRLFGGLWLVVNRLEARSFDVLRSDDERDSIAAGLQSALKLLSPFTLKGKELLNADVSEARSKAATSIARMLLRSYGELSTAASGSDRMVLRHHLAIYSDSVQHALELVNRLNFGEPTELTLPKEHPHARRLSAE